MKKTLTIAGSDSCGGAGIQADIKSMSANGVYAMSVITAITAQNTMGVVEIEDVSPSMIKAQIKAIFDDIEVDAIKIGMVSKSGFKLLSDDAKDTLVKELFPLATLITPNLPEAEEILGIEITNLEEMKEAAVKLLELGAKAVLVKGGHLEDDATDLLYDGKKFTFFEQKRINTKHTHGTGCTLSSAIAANLAKGMDLTEAVTEGKEYITGAIEHGFELGHGVGPTNHFYKFFK